MFYLYAHGASIDALTPISSLTTTASDEYPTDDAFLASISLQMDPIQGQNYPYLGELFDYEQAYLGELFDYKQAYLGEFFDYEQAYLGELFDYEQAIQETTDGEQKTKSFGKQIGLWIVTYLKKFAGSSEKRPKRIAWHEYIWSFIGSFIGILVVALMHYRLLVPHNLSFLIGSFGASAVLIYGAPNSPLAQPRNFIGGHFLSAIVGCAWRVAIDRFEHSVTVALAVATSIVVMQFTETVHPPGGATALIAVTTQPLLPWANFLYIFLPVLAGTMMMLIVALLVNNLSNHRAYPTWWW